MDWYSQHSYCSDLPTSPVPGIGRILVTGASGYIGGRLVPELVERGYQVRAMVMSHSEAYAERWPGAEIVVADALDADQLRKALSDVSVAYYLIHSMLTTRKRFAETELRAVVNFQIVAQERKLQRIIFLGTLGESRQMLSGPLDERMNVAKMLSKGSVPVTILRAALIFGSGSASFEILDHIVRNSPVFFLPYWSKTPIQPISIRDVIKYLVGVLETRETEGKEYDIGGDDILNFREMMKILGKLLHKRRLFLPSPFSSIRLYSYLMSLISPVPAQIVASILNGLKKEVIVRNDEIKKKIDFKTIRFKVTLLRALSREEHDKISTRWSDAYPPAHELSIKLRELDTLPRYRSEYFILTEKKSSEIFEAICQIGGNHGWFNTNWMWRIRGRIDRLFMGVGTSRGRRSANSLRINDVIDFWRVEELEKDKRLILRAEMRLPGKAWLEFKIEPELSKNRLTVIAYFSPRGFAGKLYWYNFLPFHHIIFKDLTKQLTR